MKLITELKLNPGFSDTDVYNSICKKSNVRRCDILSYEIIKQGIDARKKPNVFYVVSVALDVDESIENKFKHLQYHHTAAVTSW